MTAKQSLAEWLLAQYDADEQRTDEFHGVGCSSSWWEHDRLGYDADECDCGYPVAVLADLAAKRAIVELHEHDFGAGCGCGPETVGCSTCHLDQGYVLTLGWCQTLRLLALPYADRPGYDEAWKPGRP